MVRKNLSARVFTLITAFALICSFVVQNVTINAFAAVDFELTKSSVKVNGNDLTDGMTVNNGGSLDVRLEWQLSNSSNEQDFQYKLNLKHIAVNANNLQGDLIEENAKIGTYSISNDIVNIHLDSAYATAQQRKIWLNFGGMIIANEIEEPAQSQVEVAVATAKANVFIDYPKSILSAEKEAVGKAYQAEDGCIYQDFAVKVCAVGLVNDVVLSDRYGDFLSDVSNVKIGENSASASATNDGFEISIGTVNNEEKTITYTLKVSDEALSDSCTEQKITNYVYAVYKNNKGEDKSTAEKSACADVEKPSVMKTGTIDNSGLITWTITLSGGSINLEDRSVTVIDTPDFKSYCVDSDIAEILESMMLSDFTKQADGTYTFTYKTQVKNEFLDSYAQVPIENIVTMEVDNNEYTYECTDAKKTAVYTEGVGIGVKECTGLTAENKMKWKITVTIPDKKFGDLTVSDKVTAPAQTNDLAYHSIDTASITVNGQALDDTIGSIVTKTTEGHGVTGFDLTVTNAFLNTVKGDKLVVEYTTTAENADELISGEKRYGNTLKIDYVDTVTYENQDYEYKGHQEVNPESYQNQVFNFIAKEKDSKSEQDTYTTDKALGWKLKADLHNIDYKAGDIITLTDTLPANMKLTDKFSANLYMYVNDTKDEFKADLPANFYTKTIENGKLKITVPVTSELISYFNEKLGNQNAANAVIKFHCQTEIDNEQEYLNSDDFYFTNTLNGKYNDKDSKPATATQELKPAGTVISKRAYYNTNTSSGNADYGYTAGKLNAKYLININENKYKFSDNGTIKVVDKMGSSLQLIPESISVTDAETNQVLTAGTDYKFTYDTETRTTTFTVPDERYLKIEYWVSISDPKGSKLTDASNDVSINGYTSKVTTRNTKLSGNVKYSNAGAISGKPYVNLYKYWTKDSQMTFLGGAKFQLTQVNYNAQTGNFEPAGNPVDYVTKDNAVTKLTVAYDKIYELKEIKAPDGFAENTVSRYFAIPGQDNIQVPQGVDVEIYSYGQNIYVENNQVIDISGTKTWNDNGDALGIRPEDLEVSLFADGQKLNVTPTWIKGGDKWTYTFKNQKKYNVSRDNDGNRVKTLIKYTVKETAVPYYTASQNNFDFTNTVEDEKISVNGTKTWFDNGDSLGIRPETITVTLIANGNVMNNIPVWNKTNSDVWSYSFKDLPKYTYSKDATGKVTRKAVVYTVKESTVPYYTSAQDGYNFKNTVENEKVNINGTKTWADNSDALGIRPESITVSLFANDNITNNIPVWTKSGDTWEYSFKDLPKYSYAKDADGRVTRTAIDYSVKESAVPYYTTTQSGYNFKNTVEDIKVDIKGTKTWAQDYLTTRPDSITVKLMADGAVIDGKTPVWSNTDKNVWNYTFGSLPKYKYENKNGTVTRTEIKYTVLEEAVTGYTATYSSNTFDITNTYVPKWVDVTGTKTWKNDNADYRPQTVQLILKADGNAVNGVQPVWSNTDSDVWTYKFENLPERNTQGNIIKYTVEEIVPENYTVSYSGNDITNTLKVIAEISKQDITGQKELSGAKLEVKDLSGNVIDSWTTDGTAHKIIGKLEAGKSYTLTEVTAPNGYYVAETITFEVNADGTVTKVVMKDKPTEVEVSKKSVTGSDELVGAKLKVTDLSGNVIDSWTSTDEAHKITGKLNAGESYKLTEVTAPSGYYVAETITFEVKADGTVTKVVMKDKPTQVEISKQDITNGSELAGAELKITDLSGNVIDSWTSTDEAHKITAKLDPGTTYILTETAAPNGYYTAESVTFSVSEDGSVTKVVMKDKPTDVEISKQDITDGSELVGAKLEVKDSQGNVIDSWTSTDEAHKITAKLNPSETYTLTEITAPNGYYVAEDITFTVNQDGSVTKVTMKDQPTEAEISKQDITDGSELVGAKLEVTDSQGNVIDSWISTEQAHKITAKLNPGETYTLTEITAPDGYSVAESIDFTVSDDGSVVKVTMKDKLTEVEISKQDITTGKELPGAKLEVTDLNGNVIDSWVSSNEPHKITGKLNAGQTYKLTEVTAPDGYAVAETVVFKVNSDETVTKVVMKDKKTDVEISKQDITNGKELPGAKLEVTDLSGNVIDSWVSTNESHKITGKLKAGETYKLTEITAPDGYSVAETVEFTVNTDGSVTKVVMQDKKTQVKVSKQDITDGKELTGAKLEVTDLNGNVIDSWTSDGTPHMIEGKLNAGQTYKVTEITAPDGYEVAESIEFKVNLDDSITVVVMKDKPIVKADNKSISKKDSNNPNTGVTGTACAAAALLLAAAAAAVSRKKK